MKFPETLEEGSSFLNVKFGNSNPIFQKVICGRPIYSQQLQSLTALFTANSTYVECAGNSLVKLWNILECKFICRPDLWRL
jgi:hypothetical protein